MTQDDQKQAAAEAALRVVEAGTMVGVGTGSTANYFIDALAGIKDQIAGAVASSEATADRLRAHGIPVHHLADVGALPLYVDGADEANGQLQLIKGGGGALTREKIVAAASDFFVCIVDASKQVKTLGAFPLPVEVNPSEVAPLQLRFAEMGGKALLRDGFTGANGNLILDVEGLDLADPVSVESIINRLPGVVTCGLFALRPADRLIIGTDSGVVELP